LPLPGRAENLILSENKVIHISTFRLDQNVAVLLLLLAWVARHAQADGELWPALLSVSTAAAILLSTRRPPRSRSA
jgi:hypothetical protein